MRLFAIGLGLSAEGLRTNLNASIALAAIKLVLVPLIVYGLCLATNLNPLNTIAAVICAAVPTAQTSSSWPAPTRWTRTWSRPRYRSRRCCRW
jgi:predicted permease